MPVVLAVWGARRRARTCCGAFVAVVAVVLMAGCAATSRRVEEDGDVIFRSGPTTVGWAAVIAVAVVAGTLVTVIALVGAGVIVSGAAEALRARDVRAAAGWIVGFGMFVAIGSLMAWAFAANTILKHQAVVVTASPSAREITYERQRLVGSDVQRRFPYADVVAIEFRYVSGVPGESGHPPQGIVALRNSTGSTSRVFDGSPCVARELVDGVAEVTKAPIEVEDDGRDASSIGNFLTQLRCGSDQSFDVDRWPSEVLRVLDLPFLWRWPWTVPVVLVQLGLIVGSLAAVARWRQGQRRTLVMVTTCGVSGMVIIGMHVVATRSYGRWPAALALFALLSAKLFARRAGLAPGLSDVLDRDPAARS